MAVSRERIRDLLGNGLSAEVVASAVGCTPSYISQLMSEDGFSQEVAALRVKHLSAANERDKKIDSLEDRILARLSELVDTVYKPQQLTSMFAVLNRAVRRGQPAHESVIVAQQIVNLTIPAAATRNFVVNQSGGGVQIGGQTMGTMPTHELLRKLSSEATSAQASKRYAHVSNYLPSAAREIGVDDV